MNWIKLWDIPEDHWLNADIKYFGAWVKLIRAAEYKDRMIVIRGTKVEAKRGNVYTSVNRLAEEWGVTRRMVGHFLELCQQDGMVDVQRVSNRYMVVKINNYAKYQDRRNAKRTTDRATDDTTESTTDSTTERVFFLTNKQNIQTNRRTRARKNSFADFPQRDTDYDAIFKEVQ